MAIVRRTTSVLGKSIVGDINTFLKDNAKAMENDKNITPENGAEALAHAISYGVAKALASSVVDGAFKAGICQPAGGPVGSLISNVLKSTCKEL